MNNKNDFSTEIHLVLNGHIGGWQGRGRGRGGWVAQVWCVGHIIAVISGQSDKCLAHPAENPAILKSK